MPTKKTGSNKRKTLAEMEAERQAQAKMDKDVADYLNTFILANEKAPKPIIRLKSIPYGNPKSSRRKNLRENSKMGYDKEIKITRLGILVYILLCAVLIIGAIVFLWVEANLPLVENPIQFLSLLGRGFY